MAESIQCYQCGTRMTLEELASNDGDCPECDVEIHLAEYLSKALADIAVLRAQLSSQGGESCKWVRDEDTGAYETQCGTTWHLIDGGDPEEHGQLYCHHCGSPIDDEAEGHA